MTRFRDPTHIFVGFVKWAPDLTLYLKSGYVFWEEYTLKVIQRIYAHERMAKSMLPPTKGGLPYLMLKTPQTPLPSSEIQ